MLTIQEITQQMCQSHKGGNTEKTPWIPVSSDAHRAMRGTGKAGMTVGGSLPGLFRVPRKIHSGGDSIKKKTIRQRILPDRNIYSNQERLYYSLVYYSIPLIRASTYRLYTPFNAGIDFLTSVCHCCKISVLLLFTSEEDQSR